MLDFKANYIAVMLVCEATIFQSSSNFWRFIVVFPTTFCLEFGKVTDEIRLQDLDLDAFGFDEPHPFTIRIPVNVGIMELLQSVKLFRIDDNQKIG